MTRSRSGPAALVAAVALSVTGLLGACDLGVDVGVDVGVDRADLERRISERIAEELGVTPESVDCQDGLDGVLDARVTCSMTTPDGGEHDVTVIVTGVDGGQIDFDIQVDGEPLA